MVFCAFAHVDFYGALQFPFVGFFQNHVLSVFDCIFFERDEQTDRRLTVERFTITCSTS